nr:Flp family type IVb pilin [uncultured Janthinobacterium sp.]
MNFIKNFIADEEGVTAIEYALIAALVAAALVGGIALFTDGLADAFGKIGAKLKATTL